MFNVKISISFHLTHIWISDCQLEKEKSFIRCVVDLMGNHVDFERKKKSIELEGWHSYKVIKNRVNTNLYSRLGQVDLERDFFTHENIGISRLAKQRLENVELGPGECGAFASLLAGIHSCNKTFKV